MLQQIDKILKSNWSTEWFNDEKLSDQYDLPIQNLNKLTDQLNLVISQFKTTKNNQSDKLSLKLNTNNKDKLADLLVHRSNMSEDLFNESVSNTSIDLDELYDYLHSDSFKNDGNRSRVDQMHKLFCDKQKFTKIVHVGNDAQNMNNSNLLQTFLCNMTIEQLEELDNLVLADNESIGSRYLKDLGPGLEDFSKFAQVIEDLSALSIHFPTGLCKSKNADSIMKEGNEIKNKRKPESIISENTSGDAQFKKS